MNKRKLSIEDIEVAKKIEKQDEDNSEIIAKLTEIIRSAEKNHLRNVCEDQTRTPAIDLLHLLSQSKFEKLDFHFIGKCLEVATKIYCAELDLLYTDVVRMSSFLGKRGTVMNKHQIFSAT